MTTKGRGSDPWQIGYQWSLAMRIQNRLCKSLIMTLSDVLISYADKADRKSALAATLNVINRWLLDRRICMAVCGEGPLFLLGAHIPLWRELDSLHQILHVHVDMCRIFSSATRAPFVLAYESVNLDEASGIARVLGRLSRCIAAELRLAAVPEGRAWHLFLWRSVPLNIHWPHLPCSGDPSTESEHLHRLIKQACVCNAPACFASLQRSAAVCSSLRVLRFKAPAFSPGDPRSVAEV
eukprot:Skav234134  [mRNA]  locus=scaffold753:295699:298386:- [translate_table: standard]